MDKYWFRTRKQEKKFFKDNPVYRTGLGKKHRIQEVTKDHLYIQSQNSEKVIPIPRKEIRKAIHFTFHVRTITRKDLERFSNFNSAMFGIMILVFQDIAYQYQTPHGLLRLTLKGVRFYFSGLARSPKDREFVLKNGGDSLCLSYFHLRDMNPDRWVPDIRNKCKVLIDSGAFSLFNAEQKLRKKLGITGSELQLSLLDHWEYDQVHQAKLKPIKWEEYGTWVKKYLEMGVITDYINLDVFGNSEETKRNQKRLEQLVGKAPIPVYHWDAPIEDLDELVQEGHPVIALGGIVALHGENEKKAFFQKVFARHPGVRYHWLGGSSKLLFEFNFFSADSTSYLMPRINGDGTIITPYGFDYRPEWSTQECIAFNIRILSSLEEAYHQEFQLEMAFSYPEEANGYESGQLELAI